MRSAIISSILIVVLFSGLHVSLTQPIFSCTICNNSHGDYTSDNTYGTNLKTLLRSITSKAQIDDGFFNFSVGLGPDKVYAMAVCELDRPASDCLSCLNYAATRLPGDCPTQKEAIGYYDSGCMLRYSSRSMVTVMEEAPSCTLRQGDDNGTKCNQTLEILLEELIEKAAAGDARHKFAPDATNVTASVKIYALTQCNSKLSSSDCSTSLQQQISKLSLCSNGTTGARFYGPSCIVEFDSFPFINLASPICQSPRGKGTVTYKVWITIGVLLWLFMLLATISFWFLHRRKRKMQKEIERNDEIRCVDSLKFDYEAMQAATDNFSDANRLVKGVYKGILPSGQEIVVQKFTSGKDSEVEFNNEVLLLANLQHRNLVKLLGVYNRNDARLLIHEFLPNGSLDWFLDDPIKRAQLDWEIRHKIILGIARGLLYLHEDSHLRVIHQDLKASNILLDGEMNPKISNFSKAIMVHASEPTGGTSEIMGTYGYMPPEYVLQEHFSVKSDVFSYGVLLLEIISGQTINNFTQGENNEETLVCYAWRKWSEGEALDVVDRTMQSIECYMTQILKCIKIALLCVQEDPTCRPTMLSVVFMLNSETDIISEPSRPAFIIYGDVPLSSSDYSAPSNQGSVVKEASTAELEPR